MNFIELGRWSADWHWLIWVVPTVCGALLASLGARLDRSALAVISLAGIGWPLLQTVLAAFFFMWGAPAGYNNQLVFSWMTSDMFTSEFMLDMDSCWALSTLLLVTLAVQLHALSSARRLSGRHRYYALMQFTLVAGVFLFTGQTPVPMLMGWEGMALATAFMAGFWETERSGGRTGMRWLLFQRASGLLLMIGLYALSVSPTVGMSLVLGAAVLRSGQAPFHGWLPDTARAPATTGALIHGVVSLLAAVFVLIRLQARFYTVPVLPEVALWIGVAGVAFGMLAGLQQREPSKTLGWLFVLSGGFAFMALGLGEPVAAALLAVGQSMVLAGLTLAAGSLIDVVAFISAMAQPASTWRSRWAFAGLSLAWVLPPSVGFMGMGRLLAAADAGPHLKWFAILALGGWAVCGWIAYRMWRDLANWEREPGRATAASLWSELAPGALAVISLLLGGIGLVVHGPALGGGPIGLKWAAGCSGALWLGWCFSWLVRHRRTGFIWGRLSRAQQFMEKVAGTGLGLGELVVQLPVGLGKLLGVLLHRVVSDVIIDTLVFGTVVHTIEGVGIVLRTIQNGRLQRYTLIAVLAALALMMTMLR